MQKNFEDIVSNFKVTHPLQKAYANQNRYWTDFLDLHSDYKQHLSTQDYEHFLSKCRLDCEINNAQYLQFASEVTIVDYVIRNYKDFKNEPQYNNKKNPECSFGYEGRTVNIEVKAPDLRKRASQEDSRDTKIYAAERFPNKQSYEHALEFIKTNMNENKNIQVVDRMDNKLKDYLLSAHEKFPDSSTSYFNILVIAVDTIPDMDEWYSYIWGDNGVFTEKTYVLENYNNIDAIMLTNVQHGHMADNVDLTVNCWKLENYMSLLFLNPKKNDKNHNLEEYFFKYAIKLFDNRTLSFLMFLEKLDRHNDKCISQISKNLSNKNELKKLRLKLLS